MHSALFGQHANNVLVCFLVALYVSAAHPVDRRMHYVFDLFVRQCVCAYGRDGRVRPACRRLLFDFLLPLSFSIFITARCYASAVLAMGLCLSVCLSVTSRSSTKTAKRRITQTTPHDSPGTLVFRCQRSPRNSTGVTPYEGAECRWGRSKSATFD